MFHIVYFLILKSKAIDSMDEIAKYHPGKVKEANEIVKSLINYFSGQPKQIQLGTY